MAPNPKKTLSDKQWKQIEERIEKGESCYRLGKEFKIPENTIRGRYEQNKRIKDVAVQLVTAEKAVYDLPATMQVGVMRYAQSLRNISYHLACGSEFGASTFHRLSGIANARALEIDDIDPDMDKLKTVAVLTQVANEAARSSFNLLNANKELMEKENAKGSEDKITKIERSIVKSLVKA